MIQDIRYAIRILLQQKGWTLVAVLSLALGIGANTAIFSVFDALVLKSLPVEDPEELVALRGNFSYRFYEVLRDEKIFLDVFTTAGTSAHSVEIDNGLPENTPISLVSGSYFAVLGVPAVVGRTFTTEDDRPSAEHSVAVISHGYWQRRLASDPNVIGRSIRVNGAPATIIGVTPPEFSGEQVGAAADMWLPLAMWPQVVPGRNVLQSPGTAWLSIIGRQRPGAGLTEMEATLTVLYRRVLTDIFGPNAAEDDRRDIARAVVALVPANNGVSALRRQFSGPLQLVFGLVALMLLIACANVANLLLARGESRKREIGLRLALGVGRWRLTRQLLTENLLLSGLSAIVGVAIGSWGKTALLRLASATGAPPSLDAALDGRVLSFALSLSLATAVVFGFAPMWQAMRVDLMTAIQAKRDGWSRGTRIGSTLVAVQVALALILLTGAGLFLKTLSNLRTVDLGFKEDRLVMIDVNPQAARYERDRYPAYARSLFENLRTTPGITNVTFSENGVFMSRESGSNRMRPSGFVPDSEGIPRARFDVVGPDYFATMSIPVVAGRDIRDTDNRSAPNVVVINETMARRFFRGANAVGHQMLWGAGNSERSFEVIGVVPDVKQASAREQDVLRFYVPFFQQPEAQLANRQQDQSLRFVARTGSSEVAAIPLVQQRIQSLDPRVPILGIVPLSAIVERTFVQERMVAMLSSAFAVVAVVLTGVGLYGLMAFRVARRTAEIGIRMALGASASSVAVTVMRESLKMVVAGALVGVASSLVLAELIAGMLFGVTSYDPAVLTAAAAAMIGVAGLAAYLPARRASRLNPLTALRRL